MTKRQTADRFGVTLKTVDNWVGRGMPHEKDGREYRIDPVAVEEWRAARDAEQAPTLDLTYQRARLAKAQADNTELDVAVKRGELIPADAVKLVWTNRVVAARARLLSLPSTAALRVAAVMGGDVAEIQEILTDTVHEALGELTELDAGDYGTAGGAEGDGRGSGDVGAAAEADGERVGRPKPSARKRKQQRAGQVED